MQFHPFLGFFGAPGPIFRKMFFFAEKCENTDFMISSQILDFFGEHQDFHENGGITKTPIIPKEYQGLRRVDGPPNAKFRKFTENHGFH